MEDILQRIAAAKRLEVEAAMSRFPLSAELTLQERVKRTSMAQALRSGSGIIAEFKRRSPSKGEIAPMADAAAVAAGYEEAGASAMSVLTDTRFFGGALTDLMVARSACALPILRKEFIVSEFQIAEAKRAGADAVLLIASILTPAEVARFSSFAHECGLEVLLELHTETEAAYPMENVDMVGVNNRNLRNFSVDIDHTLRLASLLPSHILKVAESGLTSMADVSRLRAAGYEGFLIGERFMREPNPAEALHKFLHNEQ